MVKDTVFDAYSFVSGKVSVTVRAINVPAVSGWIVKVFVDRL